MSKRVEHLLGLNVPKAVILYNLYHHIFSDLKDGRERQAALKLAFQKYGRHCATGEELNNPAPIPSFVPKDIPNENKISFIKTLHELRTHGDLDVAVNVLCRMVGESPIEYQFGYFFMMFTGYFLPFEIKANFMHLKLPEPESNEAHPLLHQIELADLVTLSYDQFYYLLALQIQNLAGDARAVATFIKLLAAKFEGDGEKKAISTILKEATIVDRQGLEELLKKIVGQGQHLPDIADFLNPNKKDEGKPN